jgi:hypothetical protein
MRIAQEQATIDLLKDNDKTLVMVQVMRPLYLNDYDSMVMAQVLHLMTINPYWDNSEGP